jgi:type IV pilus assembly protein PilC
MPVREYRFTGTNVIGEPVRGTIFAPHKRAAERRIGELSESHHFEPEELERRRTYLYKVRHPSGEVAKGEQKAYSAEEVQLALERMGLEVLSVQPKLLDIQRKPPSADVVMFVRLAANMLRRKLPFDEVLNLLIVDTDNAALRQVMRDLSSDLKSGMDARQAFLKHQHVLGKFTAYMLGLAAVSGNMANMFEATAQYLERKDEFKKNVRSALITPTITFIAAIAATVWYVWILNPQIIGLFSEFDVQMPPFTAASMAFAAWMDVYGWLVIIVSAAAIVGFIIFARTTKGRFYIHKYMIRLPYVGPLLHKLNLEVFCRVFSVLYAGSNDNQEVMKIASEATGNTYIEHQVKTITVPTMMARGTDLVLAMEASGVFLPLMIARFRSGAETGSVQESADEMAEFYQKETTLKMASALESIKTFLAIFVGLIVLFLTILSAETALMMPDTSQMMFNPRG